MFIVSFIGVAVTAGLLLDRHGSTAWTQFAVVIGTGLALIATMTTVYLAYSAARFRRFSESTLRQASEDIRVPPKGAQNPLRELLSAAASNLAEEQSLDRSLVRAALFSRYGEVLRIVPGLTWHLDDPDEQQIEIGIGEGSAGKAFKAGRPNIAIYHRARNDTSFSDPLQRSRVDPNLKWVISTPIFAQQDDVIGVLNVDGLETEKTWQELEKSVGGLIYWAQLAGLLLGAREEMWA